MPRLSTAESRRATWATSQAGEVPILEWFYPNAGGQVDALESTKRQVWLSAANKSGKSYVMMVECAYENLPELDNEGNQTGYLLNPYKRKRIPANGLQSWISTYSQPVQRETIQPIFELLLGPYLTSKRIEKDTYLQATTAVATIHFKWQEAKKKSYEGANIHSCFCDEPHEKAIYGEILSRFARTKGIVWVAATLVIDAEDPDAYKKLKYVEWMANVINEWETDPDKHPELDVIFMDIEENPHVDAEAQMRMWSILSEQERHTRKTGRLSNLYGKSWFNKDVLDTVERYLRVNSERYTPEYGMLEYNISADKVEFVPRGIHEFPDYPRGEFTIKIWERPVADNMLTRPQYFIGCDAAEGKVGGDYIAVYVIRGDTNYVVAGLHGNLDEIELAKQLYLLGHYYSDWDGKPARLSIEVNNFGRTTQTYLITGNSDLGIPKYGITRMYHRPSNQDLEKGLIVLGDNPGWLTTGKTRGYLMTAMRQGFLEAFRAIEESRPCPLPDAAVPYEGKFFVMNKNGKYEAMPTKYDDRIFAWAIAKKCAERYYRKPKPVLGGFELDVTDDDTFYYGKDGKTMYNLDALLKKARNPKRKELFI